MEMSTPPKVESLNTSTSFKEATAQVQEAIKQLENKNV